MADKPVTPTPKQIEDYCQNLITKFKQEPNYELQLEFGKMLMRHIDSFTPEERKRYDEIRAILCPEQKTTYECPCCGVKYGHAFNCALNK